MEPSNVYVNLIDVVRKYLALVGCDFYNPNYRMNVVTYGIVTLITVYCACTLITVYKEFPKDPKFILEAFTTSNCALIACVKLYSLIRVSKRISETHRFITEIYQEYEKKHRMYQEATRRNADLFRKVVKLVSILYLMVATLLCSTPLAFYFFKRTHYLIGQFHVPYLDLHTDHGYLATLSIHILMTLLVCVGFCGSDILLIGFMLQQMLFADIFKCKVQDVNTLVATETAANEAATKQRQIAESINDLVQWHQQLLKFTENINDIFSVIISTVVISCSVSIMLALFITMFEFWPCAYPFMALGFYSIYVYCAIGTRIEICNEDLLFEVYNIDWPQMLPAHQRDVLLMLKRAQMSQEVLIAGVLPVSVSTATSITKTIYTAFTMMLQLTAD